MFIPVSKLQLLRFTFLAVITLHNVLSGSFLKSLVKCACVRLLLMVEAINHIIKQCLSVQSSLNLRHSSGGLCCLHLQ